MKDGEWCMYDVWWSMVFLSLLMSNDGMISLVAFKGYYVKERAGVCNYTNS